MPIHFVVMLVGFIIAFFFFLNLDSRRQGYTNADNYISSIIMAFVVAVGAGLVTMGYSEGFTTHEMKNDKVEVSAKVTDKKKSTLDNFLDDGKVSLKETEMLLVESKKWGTEANKAVRDGLAKLEKNPKSKLAQSDLKIAVDSFKPETDN